MLSSVKEKAKLIIKEIRRYREYNRRERSKEKAVKNIIGRIGRLAGYGEKYKGDY